MATKENSNQNDDEYINVEACNAIIDKLNKRASERHRVASYFLGACFLIIAGGLVIFTYAYKLNNFNNINASFNKIRMYDSLVSGSVRTMDSLTTDLNNLRKVTQNNQMGSYFGIAVSIKDMLERERVLVGPSLHALNEVADDVRRIDFATINFEFFNNLSIRIGVVIILFFLVQNLLRIYRYNIRLGNYLKARADAIELYLQDDSLPLDKLVEMLSPDSLDIGIAKAPIDQVVEIFKHAQNQQGKKSSE